MIHDNFHIVSVVVFSVMCENFCVYGSHNFEVVRKSLLPICYSHALNSTKNYVKLHETDVSCP